MEAPAKRHEVLPRIEEIPLKAQPGHHARLHPVGDVPRGIHPDSLLVYLRRRWPWTLGLALLTGIAATLWLRSDPAMYTSYAIVQMRTWHPDIGADGLPFPELTPAAIGTSNMATSSAMVDRLIASLDLFQRMEIDPRAPGAQDRLRRAVEDMVSVQQMENGKVALTAECADKQLAVDVANAMFHELVALNDEQDLQDLQRAVTYCSLVIDDERSRHRSEMDALNELTTEIKQLRESHLAGASDRDLRDVYLRASEVLGAVERADDEMVSDKRRRELAASLISGQSSSNVHLLRLAVPDTSTSPAIRFVGGILLCIIVTILLTTSLFSLWYRGGQEFVSYFTEPNRG